MIAWALLTAGCHIPPMDATIHMPEPVDARVRTEVPPVIDNGPVKEVPLPVPGCGTAPEKVAVLDVDGVLANLNYTGLSSVGENPVSVFKEKLDAAAADEHVRAVVLRINTPGGSAPATDLMAHDLQEFRRATGKPVVACLLDLGAGGGYYLAAGCDAVVAIPTSIVGGIGVVLNLYFAREAMAYFNFFDDSVRAGAHIDMGSPVRKVSEEEKKMFEGMAKAYHEQFRQAVRRGRPQLKAGADVFDGRVMSADQARQVGLVDHIGYLSDALAEAVRRAGCGPAQAVLYRRCGDAARSEYATTPNRPLQATALPVSVPGVDRSHLPLFLYMWQPEPTLIKLTGL
jgi:protease-4